MKKRTKIEIDVIRDDAYKIRIIELMNETDNWHSITRVTTSPVLPNIQRVGYWLVKWAIIVND